MRRTNRNDWNVRFEVTFYGNDQNKGSFREIKEDNIDFNDQLEIENKLPSLISLNDPLFGSFP